MKMQYALRNRPRQTNKLSVGERSTWSGLSRRKNPSRRNCIRFKVRSSKCDVSLATSNNNNNNNNNNNSTGDGINAGALMYDDDNEDDEEVRCRFVSKLLK
jgi:hypothetical protein